MHPKNEMKLRKLLRLSALAMKECALLVPLAYMAFNWLYHFLRIRETSYVFYPLSQGSPRFGDYVLTAMLTTLIALTITVSACFALSVDDFEYPLES